MSEQIVNANVSPELANKLAAEALNEKVEIIPADIKEPTDVEVRLPGGLLTFTGGLHQTAEVKELNGKDEEAIAKTPSFTKVYSTVLQRGVVSIGGEPVTPDTLNSLLLGDRDALLLGIYKATYGNTADLVGSCVQCNEVEKVQIDVDTDIKVKPLINPVEDRTFEVKGRNKTFLVTLPTGVTEAKILDNLGNNSEKVSILLEQTVLQIDGKHVVSRTQVQELGMADRQKIVEEIANRAPGPKFDDITMECPKCGGELVVPVSIGAMFRF